MLQVGTDGVSAALIRAIDEAFHTRELLKVKVLEAAPVGARAAADELALHLPGVQVPQVIGRTIVLYRPSPDGPVIQLPR